MNYDLLFDKSFAYHLSQRDVEDLKHYFNKKKGWVYVALSRDNNTLKIGRTGKNPMERAKSLSSAGVLNDYEIIFSLPFMNQFLAEKKIHNKLKKFRLKDKKEFFLVKKELAFETIEKIFIEEEEALIRFFDLDTLKEDLDLLEHCII